jgi:5-formyltetrahydrofolate cyclo-ligase
MTDDTHGQWRTQWRTQWLAQQRDDLRRQLKAARARLTQDTVKAHSQAIARLAMPLLLDARHVAGYLAMGSEVGVDDLMAQCRSKGMHTYVPIVKPQNTLVFAPLTEDTPLLSSTLGIREPVVDDTKCWPASSLDAVLVPLVGFDARCARMGMGGGYYDRAFACRRESVEKPVLIGIAHEQQFVPSVFPDWWDVQLDCVVTEQRVRYRPD